MQKKFRLAEPKETIFPRRTFTADRSEREKQPREQRGGSVLVRVEAEKLQSHPGVQHSALTLRTVCLLLENVESQESIGAEPPPPSLHCYAATLFSFWRRHTRYSETHLLLIETGSKLSGRLPCIQSRRSRVHLGLL